MPQIAREEPNEVPRGGRAELAPKDPHTCRPSDERCGHDRVAIAPQDPNHELPKAQPIKQFPPGEEWAESLVPRYANGQR